MRGGGGGGRAWSRGMSHTHTPTPRTPPHLGTRGRLYLFFDMYIM